MLKKCQTFIIESLKKKKHPKEWKIIMWSLMILTTFLTTYFLILPAITVEETKTDDVGITLENKNSSQVTSSTSSSQSSVEQSKPQTPASSVTETSSSEEAAYREEPLMFRGADYTVTVTLTKEAKIPKNADLKVTELKDNSATFKDYKKKALTEVAKQDSEIKNFKLYDITIESNGKEAEPQAPVKVEVNYDKPLEASDENLKVVHFKDDGQTEVLKSKDTAETKNTSSDVAFKTDSFSIYAIVQEDNTEVPRLTYHFQNNDGTDYNFLTASGMQVHHQIIKDGESLGEVGIPTIKAGEHFNGWYTYDPTTGKYGDPVKFGEPITVTETKEIYVRPFMSKVATVTLYDDSAGKSILERYQVPLDSSGNGTADLSSFKVSPPTSTLLFVGWSKTQNGAPLSESEIQALPVSSDISLYPVFKESYGVEFNTGDLSTGVTYIAPRRVLTDQPVSTIKPNDPTRPGYTFAGWYTAASGGTAFDFNQVLTKDTTLYAHWSPAQTTYTINYWQQSATDNKNATDAQKTYEYAGQVTRSGLSLSNQTLTQQDINAKLPTGFKVNNTRTETSVMIKDDGSSVVNVYYDRELVTMRFAKTGYSEVYYQSSSFPWTSASYAETYTGLYGTTLAANGYQWKTGAWRYLTSTGVSGMSYLGEFILPSGVRGTNPYEIKLYPVGQRIQNYAFYKQGLDGKYFLSDVGGGAGADEFTFTEKYLGFNVKYYQRLYQDNYLFDAKPLQTSANTTVSVADQYYDQYGYYHKDYLNLRVWYERNSYKINYLDPFDNTELPNFPVKDVLYEQNLSSYAPDTTTVQPKPSRPGYVWDGKWYKDQAQTQVFDFNMTMPPHDVKVYAGWQKVTYRVNIDPNGGQLSKTADTYLDLHYGDRIPEYTDITRDYIQDPSGTYYYKYDSRDKDSDSTKAAYYTTDNSLSNVDTTTKYKYVKDAYKLVGWYYVNPDGSIRPYNFSGAVTQDINLRAIWRKAGDYHIIYSNDAVGTDGKPALDASGQQLQTSNEPTDPDSYDDGSHSALLRRPTMPDGYRFRGWWYNGKIYNPYDSIDIDAHLADANKNITIKPVIIPVGDIKLEDTSIKYNGNGGTRVENGNVVTQVETPRMELNSTTTIPENQYFTRTGYNLIGWHHDKDLADTGRVEFTAGQSIGIDNNPDATNTLYAVWQPKEYTVRVSKTVVGLDEDKTKDFLFNPSETLQQENFPLRDGQTKEFKVPYGTSISIDEQAYDEFKVSESITEKNLATGEADKTYDATGLQSLTVSGDVDISFTNTRIKQKVRLQKVNVENDNNFLAGAVFDIYESDANGNKASHPMYSGLVTNDKGLLLVDANNYLSLPVGKYYLTETKAPPGYLLPKNDMSVLVISTGVTFEQNGNNATPIKENLVDGSTVYTFKITNSKGTELPSTGGIGTHIYILVGLALALPSGLILYYRKKI